MNTIVLPFGETSEKYQNTFLQVKIRKENKDNNMENASKTKSKFRTLIYDKQYPFDFSKRIFKKFMRTYNIQNQPDALVISEFRDKYIKQYFTEYLHNMVNNKIFLSKACYFELTKNKHGPMLPSETAYQIIEKFGLPMP